MAFEETLRSMMPSRRDFVQAGVGVTAAGLAAIASANKLLAAETKPAAQSSTGLIKPGDTILFQGDSITDAGRKRDVKKPNSQEALGHGYAWLVAAQTLVGLPELKVRFFNRGNSGNKVYQLAERWKADCLDLKPDVLSILIGVNDFWHTLDGTYKATLETYEKDYRALINQTKDALPHVKLVICEPFALMAGKVSEKWFPKYDAYRAAAKRIADDSGAAFVPFHSMFETASKVAPPATWAVDGVHPTSDGAALMASKWLNVVGA